VTALRMRRRGLVLRLAAICALVLASSVLGQASGVRLLAAVNAPAGAAPPGLGLSTLGQRGWRVQSSATASQTGADISTPGFSTESWLGVKPDDAGAPGTEIEALLQNGVCPHDPSFAVNQDAALNPHHVFFSDNLRRCFGFMDTVGPDTIKEFSVPWWFRTDFEPNLRLGQSAQLVINGIVGQADVWVNGVEVASQSTVRGSFAVHTFDVTDLVRAGTNSLALELFPNDSTAMLTVDNVDWTQIPPDNNTGIQFPIQLHVANALSIGDAHVVQDNAPDMSASALTVKALVTNNTGASQTGTVSAAIAQPQGAGGPIAVTQSVVLPPGSSQTVTFAAPAFPQLDIARPRIWWPYQMGGQPMYTLTASVSQNGAVSDTAPADSFGIRTNTAYLSAPTNLAPDGVRVHAINGQPFDFRAGGFGENLFLHYSAQDLANQITLIKSMGLNGIRTEGKEMPANFYEQLDRAGILIDAGFQCCDAWQPNDDGSGVTTQDFRDMNLASFSIGQRLRNHPSVINFGWSDNNPIPQQEIVSLQGLAQADFREPMVSSAEYKHSAVLGPSGEKEGPYDWVPPSYWYDSAHNSMNATDNDPTFTNVGGAWGLDSEQSAGDTVATPDSLHRFLSASELADLWQKPLAQQYHLNYESADGAHVGYHFGTLNNLDQAISKRYGQWSSLDQYILQAQVQNYEDTRAQFEAYVDHWTNQTPSTGTVYWQLNKGWPTLLWALYNSDYDQAGSYFGAKKANESLHVLYAYDTGSVTVDNLSGVTQPDVSVRARVHSLDGRVLDDQVASGLSLASQGVRNRVIVPRAPAATVPPAAAQTYWIELTLQQHGTVIDRNVYWLSTQKDVVDWNDSQGNPQALISPTASGLPQFGDLRALQGLPQATVKAVASTEDAGSGSVVTSVTVTNTSASAAVSFFLRADVRRGTAAGTPLAGDNQVLPISWSDNDITLWPGQSQTISGTYSASQLGGATPVVTLSGWNAPAQTLAAPADAAAVAARRAAAASAGVEHFGGAAGAPLVTGTATAGANSSPPGAGAGAPAASARVAWTLSSTAGRLTQGAGAGTFTVNVKNSGGAPTDGTTPVTLTDVVDPDLSFVSMAGPGWTCDPSNNPTIVCGETGGPGGRPAVLAAGQSYPPLTLTVQVSGTAGSGRQDPTAGLHVTNAVTVAGGASARPTATMATQSRVVGPANLTANDSLASAFRQGDAADVYQIRVINQGAGPTSGGVKDPITAKVSVPAGETAVALYGSGWSCDLTAAACTRSDALRGENGEAPPITLIVKVAPDAPATVTQSVTVSGGGETTSPATVSARTSILPAAAGPVVQPGQLTVTSSHAGAFSQGDAARRYTLSVRNAGSTPTQGAVTVTDTLPAGLTATRLTGNGWTCSLQAPSLASAGTSNLFEPLATCSRADSLAAGASYPPIALAVAVAGNALPSVTNTVAVSGGGPTPASTTASDVTRIDQRTDLSVAAFSSGRGIPFAPFAQGDGAAQHDSFTIAIGNDGFASTNGAVRLAVGLPAGLTAVSMSGGSRWSCSAAAATCVSQPGVSLAAGAQEIITLEVAVSGGAPRSVLTAIEVSGGGEIDRTNDSFIVPTFVTAH
jgi:exo-1,4-beta-D-glucosaminidase